MPRHVWASLSPPGPSLTAPPPRHWQRVGHFSAFAERHLWRAVRRELGVESPDPGDEVLFFVTVDEATGTSREALWNQRRPVWLAFDPFCDGRVILYSRLPAITPSRGPEHWSAPARSVGPHAAWLLRLHKRDGSFFDAATATSHDRRVQDARRPPS